MFTPAHLRLPRRDRAILGGMLGGARPGRLARAVGAGRGRPTARTSTTPGRRRRWPLEATLFSLGWVLMIVAMMLPSSIPLVLDLRGARATPRATGTAGPAPAGRLPARVGRVRARRRGSADRGIHAAVDAVPWLAEHPQLIIATTLAVAGLWQFSPLRDRCLEECRSPLGFVINRWRGTSVRAEAVRMGIAHGAFCVGCCWSLMLVMFGVGLASLSAMLVLGGLTADREEPALGASPDATARRAADPGGGLCDRRVTSASYPRRVVDGSRPRSRRRVRERRDRATRGHAGADPRRGARSCLLADGYANLSTRRVAESAGVPLSQIHYHFGSKLQLILAVLAAENERLLERQRSMFDAPEPLWVRWELACDFLDTDVASGYVRILQEMIAAGWTDAEVAASVREMTGGWYRLLAEVARREEAAGADLGGFTPDEVAALMATPFLGAEELILLGVTEDELPMRSALRKVGVLLRRIAKSPPSTADETSGDGPRA